MRISTGRVGIVLGFGATKPRLTFRRALRPRHHGAQMPLIQLIYTSRPFGFDDLTLTGILASARRNNIRDGITGALICREDLFIQMLEGPDDKVTATFNRIVHDDRHTDVLSRFTGGTDTRLFPQWAMRHDPARSWMWTRDMVAQGALDRATTDDIRAVFTRLAVEPPSTPQTCPFSVVAD
jgi:hypothetical protein